MAYAVGVLTNWLAQTSPQLAILGKEEEGMYVHLDPFFDVG